MRPLIFDMLFNDDRKFVMEICPVTVSSTIQNEPPQKKWAVINRRNVPDYPPFRTDNFDTREEAFKYYYDVVPQTPLASLGGKSPDPPISLDDYKTWLKSIGLTDKYLDIK